MLEALSSISSDCGRDTGGVKCSGPDVSSVGEEARGTSGRGLSTERMAKREADVEATDAVVEVVSDMFDSAMLAASPATDLSFSYGTKSRPVRSRSTPRLPLSNSNSK